LCNYDSFYLTKHSGGSRRNRERKKEKNQKFLKLKFYFRGKIFRRNKVLGVKHGGWKYRIKGRGSGDKIGSSSRREGKNKREGRKKWSRPPQDILKMQLKRNTKKTGQG